MIISVYDSSSGTVVRSKYKTGSIGIMLCYDEEDTIWPPPSLEESVGTYEKAIDQYMDSHKELDLFLIMFTMTIGKFNSAERFYGIWKDLARKGIVFENTSKAQEFYESGESRMIAYAKIEREEISNLLLPAYKYGYGSIVCFSTLEEMQDIFDKEVQCLKDKSEIVDSLITHDSLLVELIDIGIDGNSLTFYAKKDSSKLANLLSFFRETLGECT